jgi:16S rRNA (cytidine1402-2'-O)-methyltransferase
VVAGAEPAPANVEHAVTLVAEREAAGVPRKQAVADVARESGLSRREVYNAVVGAQREL